MKNSGYIKFFSIIFIIVILIIIGIRVIKIDKKSVSEEYKTYDNNFFIEYTKEGKVGVISKNAEQIIEPEYVDIYIPNPEKDVFICIKEDESYIILNSDKDELFKNFSKVEVLQTSEDMLDFEKEVLKYEENGKYGLIDFDGKIILNPEYEVIESLKYKPGKILVKKDGNYGVCDCKGNIIIKNEYTEILGDRIFKSRCWIYKNRIYSKKENRKWIYVWIYRFVWKRYIKGRIREYI